MNTYFYCSYKFSPVGFQMWGINDLGTVALDTDEAKTIIHSFVTGGAESILGKIGKDRYCFLMKGLDQTVEALDDNEVGKKWYINFALTCDAQELDALCACAYMAYTDFASFGDGLLAALKSADNETGYEVDFAKVSALIERARTQYERFCGTGQAEIVSTPNRLAKKDMDALLAALKNKDICAPFAFVLFSTNEAYFRNMFGLTDADLIRIGLPKSEAPRLDEKPFEPIRTNFDGSFFDEKLVKSLATGAAAVLGVVVVSKIVKKIIHH